MYKGYNEIMAKKTKENKWLKDRVKTCGRCGNTGLTKKETFICRYCGWPYGEDMEEPLVQITRGPLEE